MSKYLQKIWIQTALIADEIERTRQICARSLELLRLPVPNTFLGNRLGAPPEKEE
ncbi:hypothetical protein [Bradyrhizobium iriomotense]|uniref:hypothetical protein n=1 Tax=Bradyrhizobium iriomotense TaxID=441950 RepID=UPI001B8A689D|nr:hypothetical protein [Bradyrhizobium iriomotense]MBR1129726.1 hypothetical protein [Bradyrhizobium iriomotense]